MDSSDEDPKKIKLIERLRIKLGPTLSEKEKRPLSLKGYFKKGADDISVAGLKHCYDKDRSRLRKAVWTVIMTIGLFSAIFLIYNRITYFLTYPTTTTFNIVTAESFDYPKITICNNNQILKSGAEKYGLVDYFKQFLPPFYSDLETDPVIIGKTPNYTQELRDELSPDLNGSFWCSWQKEPCPTVMSTSEYTSSGRCLSLNPGLANISVFQAGISTGFDLLLYAGHNEYFITPEEKAGFNMQLHGASVPARVNEFGSKVILGYVNTVTFTVTDIKRLKHPYGSCVDTPGYDSVSCQIECEKKEVVRKCGCRPIGTNGNEPVCDYLQELCANRAAYNFVLQKSQNLKVCVCPPLCHELTYTTSISNAPLSPSDVNKFIKQIGWNITQQDFLYNFASVKIYVTQMEETTISYSSSYSVMGLMSDIGGALSLLLGGCLPNIFEMAELGLNVGLYAWAQRKKRMNVVNAKTQYQVNQACEKF